MINPHKFGVNEGKFLGFVEDKDGIILAIEPPQKLKQIREFIGKVSYLRRFIPGQTSSSLFINSIKTLSSNGD